MLTSVSNTFFYVEQLKVSITTNTEKQRPNICRLLPIQTTLQNITEELSDFH